MKTLIIAALLGTVAGGGVAVAQTAITPKPMRGDLNADGTLSRGEFVKQAEARFAALDVDKDGALTRAEARVGHGGRHGRFGRLASMGQDGPPPPPVGRGGGMLRQDKDGDGRISRAEFDAQTGALFARMDANGDGTVDKTEMAALPGRGRMGGRADADGSGTLTRAEFTAQAAQRFARMDANGDGVIDAAELGARRGPPGAPPAPTPPAPPAA